MSKLKKKETIALIGTVGVPPRYGGFETLAHYLLEELGDEFTWTVYCSRPEYASHPSTYLSARLLYLPFRANGASSVIYDIVSLLRSVWCRELCLVLGASGGVVFPLLRLLGAKTVLNIGGVEWRRSKWGFFSSRFLHLSEALAVRFATELVADNTGIADYLDAAYSRTSTLIEYGGDHAFKTSIEDSSLDKYPWLNRPYIFSVARIQPDNNIEIVLEAISKVAEAQLVFVGNWDKTSYGKKLRDRYLHFPNLHLLDAIYEPGELNMLRSNCALYVHAHSAGGTNPALVEAMHLGLPIAAFDVVYNRNTTENSAYYFDSSSSLTRLVQEISSTHWERIGRNMKEISDRRYRWKLVAQKYAELLRRTAAE